MKKLLLSVVAVLAMSASFANAALEPISGDDVYFGQANLAKASDTVEASLNMSQKSTIDHVVKNIDLQVMNMNNPAAIQANAQTLANALPKMDASGKLHVQLQGSNITYGTINMGMGDFTKLPIFNEAPNINR